MTGDKTSGTTTATGNKTMARGRTSMGGMTMARGRMATYGTMAATDDTMAARVSRAMSSTTTATGGTTMRHNDGNDRQRHKSPKSFWRNLTVTTVPLLRYPEKVTIS